MTTVEAAMLGGLVVACLVVSVQFMKFWTLTRDRFFVWFAMAFLVFAGSFAIRAVTQDVSERLYYAFLPRLVGFALIVLAIFDKNRRAGKG